jgi:predicted alpha/beta-hydrolase family hydrolase
MTWPAGESSVQLESSAGPLDAVLLTPESPVAHSVLAHGAGAGIQHANMRAIAEAFAAAGVATLRCNFPYMQAGKRRVDSKPVAVETIVSAAAYLRGAQDLPLLLAGHSFGGRMCSHAVVDAGIDCAGLIFCSFPLHQPKKPGMERAAHMHAIRQPVLFLSGTRDDLAQPELLSQVAADMPCAQIHWLDTANHSYVVLKRQRTNPLSVFEEMSRTIEEFVDATI